MSEQNESNDLFASMPRHTNMEELQVKLKELMKMDSVNLDAEAIRQTSLFFEVQKFYIDEGRALRWLMAKQAKMLIYRRQYYLGQLPPSVYAAEPLNPRPLKTEVDVYMRADDVMQELGEMVKESEARVKLCEQSLDRVKQRGYDLKSAIDWRKAVEQI